MSQQSTTIESAAKSVRLSRRQFVTLLAGATAGAVGIGAPVVWYFVNQVSTLPLPDEYPGDLDEDVRQTLNALVEAIFVAYPVDLNHYTSYFDFHAQNIRGYRKLYSDFMREVDRSAKYSYGLPFAKCKITPRRDVIKPWFTMPETRQERVVSALTNGIPWMLYSRYIFGEILSLFMRTDAWLLVGYEAYPGMPRNLEAYQIAIEPL